MGRTALITGATDGIGKATAIELAKREFSIHVLGRNKEKGQAVLKELKQIYPEGKHDLFLVDLSMMSAVNQFLENYMKSYQILDVLILNAGIYPSKIQLSDDGIDQSFSIGYISRYLFSVKLNFLLQQSSIGKVIHVNGSAIGSIHYSQLHAPKYSKISSVWQNSVASALLTYFWKEFSQSKVHHIHWNPGIVNTQMVKSQGWFVQFLSRLMGMLEPERAGELIANHVEMKDLKQFYFKGKPTNVKVKVRNGKSQFKELISFSESFTDVRMDYQ